jgi:hypothetical protein
MRELSSPVLKARMQYFPKKTGFCISPIIYKVVTIDRNVLTKPNSRFFAETGFMSVNHT